MLTKSGDKNDYEAANITEPSIIFRIGKLYRPNLSRIELYDVTRGRWKLSEKREKARIAFSVVNNIILEVYEIIQWFPAGTTFSTREEPAPPDRWEFIGNIANQQYRTKYIKKSVSDYFEVGAKNPVRYINI